MCWPRKDSGCYPDAHAWRRSCACAHAFAGDFARAALYAKEAVAGAPGKLEFAARVLQFEASTPKGLHGSGVAVGRIGIRILPGSAVRH
jgi:hypothetical protein